MSENMRINELDAADVVSAAQERDRQNGRWAPWQLEAQRQMTRRRQMRRDAAAGLLFAAQCLACVTSVVTGGVMPVATVAVVSMAAAGLCFNRAARG